MSTSTVQLPLLARLTRWFIRRYWPELAQFVDDHPKAMRSYLEMNKKINRLKAENEEWRQRCFSAERIVSHDLRVALEDAFRRHNETHGWPLNF